MSKGDLLAKLKLVKAQTDTTIELLSNTAAVPFSLDDEYEVDYLVGCLQSNSEKLYTLAKKCESSSESDQQVDDVTEQCGKLLNASVSSVIEDSHASQFANQSDVKDADSDETASLDSSEMSPPICGANVSDDFQIYLAHIFVSTCSMYHAYSIWFCFPLVFQ